MNLGKTEQIKAWTDLGASAEGSETDLNRLEEMFLYKDIYPKMFAKCHRTGGKEVHVLYGFSKIIVAFYCHCFLK